MHFITTDCQKLTEVLIRGIIDFCGKKHIFICENRLQRHTSDWEKHGVQDCFAHMFTKTPSVEGKWCESGAWCAVLEEVAGERSRLSHFKTQILTCYPPDLSCEGFSGFVVLKKRRAGLFHRRRKPPHAHTSVYLASHQAADQLSRAHC